MDGREEIRVEMVPIDRIRINPYQPRQRIREEELKRLARSIEIHGVIQPVVVTPVERGYQLVAGERRLRAALLVGLQEIPAVIRSADAKESALVALVENLQRQNLSYWDEAEGFLRLCTEFHLTQADIAEQMGISQSAVANKLRILHLESDIRRQLEEHGLSERHARLLLSLDSVEERRRLVAAMIQERLTVREAEEWIRRQRRDARQVKRVVKDFRIVYNAFEKTLRAVREAGVAAEMVHHEDEDVWEIRVRIAKYREG
ncbi:MAG: ParB/RepB/Spo0J family partition protein [Firmicutes bacterium]|nr:ParB/RepB/Spo0J family partition protein [Bacillota bacterium]